MFRLTSKQEQAQDLLASSATHIMLFGGSRSGKTFLIIMAMVIRALRAPRSRHVCLRFRFNSCKTKLALDTFPAVMAKVFPAIQWKMNKEDWYAILPNGSEIWFGGLDDKQRTEKILGGEYASIFLNECSEIPWSGRNVALTRLAQLAEHDDGAPLKLRMYCDENPPDKGHWTYKLFIQRLDPDSKRPLADLNDYTWLQMNPADNAENIAPEYIRLLEGQPARYQARFLRGEFRDAAPNALFDDVGLDKWRVLDGKVPDYQRVVIAVDPSGAGDTDNADNDAIGISVVGLGTDGNAYVLEDLTCRTGPATWGRIATDAYERHDADCIVGEANYGGEMVRHVIQTARPRTPYRAVTATRGKVVRAEPISSLVEAGKVRLVGYFPELEEELAGFTTGGYMGEGSPNRADACIWALTELFPALTAKKSEKKHEPFMPHVYQISSDTGMDMIRGQTWLGA